MTPDLTTDAMATYKARHAETYNVPPDLHEPSMRAIVDMVVERAADCVSQWEPSVDRRINHVSVIRDAILALKGPRP